jgi:nitrogen fixation NifU-like protein
VTERWTAAPGATSEGATGPQSAAAAGGRAVLPYSDVIRRRWRQPRHRGELAGANRSAEDVNPLCGDRVRMMLRVEDGAIREARFVGDSCAICTAAADVLSEMVEGRAAVGVGVDVADVLEALQADIRPTRMRCVTLPLSVLEKALA